MADLRSNFIGIKSPNPFWLASAPPTDKEYNVVRAFRAGWGGVVWKTLGEDPPVVNVNGPRYATLWSQDRRVIGFNNIELISARPLQVNLDEIRRVKRDFPDRAMIVSLMVPSLTPLTLVMNFSSVMSMRCRPNCVATMESLPLVPL